MAPAEVRELEEAWWEREKRLDFASGQICYIVAEANRDGEKRAMPFTPGDFFPSLAKEVEVLDDEAMTAKLDKLGA